MLTDILEQIMQSPLLSGAALIIIFTFVFFLFKKLVKIALAFAAIVILGFSILAYSTDDPVGKLKDFIDDPGDRIEKIKDKTREFTDDFNESIRDSELKKDAEDLLDLQDDMTKNVRDKTGDYDKIDEKVEEEYKRQKSRNEQSKSGKKLR